MTVPEDKRFYWLKLHKDFFKRHEIRIVEGMQNGKDYILFYLKLLCESVCHEGKLRFSESIPYNEEMLSVLTNTNIDTVRSAVKIFRELGMMELLDDETIYMKEVEGMIGSETKWAGYRRESRERTKLDNVQQMSNDVQQMSNKRIENRDKSIDIRDIDNRDIEIDVTNTPITTISSSIHSPTERKPMFTRDMFPGFVPKDKQNREDSEFKP